MRKVLFTIAVIWGGLSTFNAQTYEYKIITSVESIIPSGLGRSRIIDTNEKRNHENFTSERTDGKNKKDTRNKSKRSDVRVKNFEETKLLNFFNIAGIRFQNIAANDAVITSKINALAEAGWELTFSNSAVESYAGKGDKNGIFITRYIFKRLKE
jgi:hypothetical protein